MTGTIGLTEKQTITLNELQEKKQEKGITAKQEITLRDLIEKRENVELPQTTRTYLDEIFIAEMYGRKKDITTKYMEKGLLCEEDALELLGRVEGQLLLKNKDKYENKWIVGTPDNTTKKVRDTKASWDIFTFFKSGMTTDYEWQLRGYMWLTELEESTLAYCLVDTPQHLIYEECKRLAWRTGVIDWEVDEEFQKKCEEIEKNMTFADIPDNERVRQIHLKRDLDKEKELQDRIKLCRAYLNNKLKQHGKH